jgi:hypothetical protein
MAEVLRLLRGMMLLSESLCLSHKEAVTTITITEVLRMVILFGIAAKLQRETEQSTC